MLRKIFYWCILLTAFCSACSSNEEAVMDQVKKHLANAEYKQAAALLDQVIANEPGNADALNMRGVAQFELKNMEAALNDFNAAIKAGGNSYKYYYNRGNVYREVNNSTEALKDYNKAIELDANIYDLYVNRGIIYSRMNRFNESLADFNKAAALNATDKNIFYNRGRVYMQMNNFKKATEDLHHCVEISPEFGEGHYYLAKAEMTEAGDQVSEETCNHLRRAVDLGYKEAQADADKYCKEPN